MRNTSVQIERRALRAALLLETDRAPRARAFFRRLLTNRARLHQGSSDLRSSDFLPSDAPKAPILSTVLAEDALLEHIGDRDRHLSVLRAGIARCSEPYASYLVYRTARIEYLRGHLESAQRILRDHRLAWPIGQYDHREPRLLESAVLRSLGRRTEALALAESFIHEDAPASIRMRAHFHRAAALQALGRIEEVEAEYRRALALTLPLGAARLRALIFTNLTLTAAASGDANLAQAYAREGVRRLEALGDRLMLGKALAGLARHDTPAIDRAREVASQTADREVLTELAILDVQRDKHRARVSLRESLWDNETLGVDTFAAKARVALAGLEDEHALHLVLGPHRAVLVEGSTSRAIDLTRHEKLRRVLRRLAFARTEGEGAISVEALLVSVWPGEALVGNSGPNRVYTAIRSLRRFGLEDVLRSSSAGYELTCPVRYES